MKILVTGAAGFIGSHLCEELLKDKKHNVIGIDDFIGPTPFSLKLKNLKNLLPEKRFTFIKENLLTADLAPLLEGVDVIFHLAAIPGVRSSWGNHFHPYAAHNIQALQRLLEGCREHSIQTFVFASTSSVYGEKQGKVSENTSLSPLSPYGVTKLTGEKLCHVYKQSFGIPIVILRFFTVYGPRQRPDMAFHRLIKQHLQQKPLTIFGDGQQSRDFTYISDCVKGITAVLEKPHLIGETVNIGGAERASVLKVVSLIEDISGRKATLHFSDKIAGEPRNTWADISKAKQLLHYDPATSLKDGLTNEIAYLSSLYQGE
ncbi:NAD-dependent epimerase/dehydratase family protein [Bacillus subtilis]|uniref:NAD-dependent epimerase/dehydratase family protein n=1 Tax=Bacillus subtilis TaxID=1423 RepID=UPI00132EEFCD|nr:NAD-dependent epimerase/dehydratase family protein [Bacillus subtilis]MCX4077901.1 NAD-dependent epimerase/dehydratase family protein [Bacillus subtilis]MEC0397621.1 NAD-dependent epimerase/dehydratase family protein [Bacillus subtilis]MEC0435675.1 NAD-dependent epimerase/dehydratase family protein [Bacillus subtilis]QHF59106.1 UDP-glucose epimerase [Bacillus subtilis]